MASLSGFIMGGLQLLAGIFLVATGMGSGIGFKLIASGALSLLAQAFGGKGRSGIENDPRYGLDNARNVTVLGMPMFVAYGEEKFAPPVLSAVVKPEGTKQTLYLQIICGEGEIDSVSDIKLNGVPLSSFPNSLRMVKRGTPGQSSTWVAGGNDAGEGGDVVVSGFAQIGQPYPSTTRLSDNGPGAGSHVHEMHAEGDEVWVMLRWPGGMAHQNDDGSTKSSEWAGRILVKGATEADSKYVEYLIPKDLATGKRVQGDFYAGTYGSWSTSANQRGVDLRRTMVVVFATRGRYTVKIEGFSDDDDNDIRVPTVVLVTEIVNEARAYPNTAILAIRCPVNEQLQGTLPVVTVRIKGRKLFDPRTGETVWSRNPALAIYDLLTNARYGLGAWVTAADLDAGVGGTFRTFADRCDELVTPPGRDPEPRYELDLIMSTKAPAREWLEAILSTCNASLFQSQGLIKIREDRDGVSVRTFDARKSTAKTTRHNILAEKGVSSLVVRHLADSERPTSVIVKHTDREQDFRPVTTTVQDWLLDVGPVAGGDRPAGTQISGNTSKAVGYLTATLRNGDPHLSYVQDVGSPAFVASEGLVLGIGASAGACATFSAPYRVSPAKPLTVQLVGVTRRSQAQRIARATLGSAMLRPLFASWGIFWGDVDLEPCDLVELSADLPAWTAKVFQVLEVAYGQNGRGRVQAREYNADPFVLVDRVPDKRTLSPGGSVPPGLRDPGQPAASAPPGGNSGGGGSGVATATPAASQPTVTTSPATGTSVGGLFGSSVASGSASKPKTTTTLGMSYEAILASYGITLKGKKK